MRKFIVGTDWWTDCDDAVAMRLLAKAILRKEVEVLGFAINACMKHSVTSLEGFLNCEGVSNLVIGIDREATDFGRFPPYQQRLTSYAKRFSCNEEAEDALRLYRRLLSEAQEPVEIVEIGYLQVVAALLESGSDDISEKSGLELVREKVSKFWVMAGKWDTAGGLENNFARNERSRNAGELFCRKCPVPVTFLGWEIGVDVITGDGLPEDDILAQVMSDHGSASGRMSWDPMLVQMALEGDETKAGYRTVRGIASVDPLTGANYFRRSESGLHCYVIKQYQNAWYREKIQKQILGKR